MLRSSFFISALTAVSLFSLPSGHKIKHGKVQVIRNEKEIVIQSGKRAIVHWDQFSVDKGERARFQMKDSKSSVLNRVSGNARSDILGNIESNGNVYLLNPKGVLIGPDSQINVNSLVASTLDVLDEEFLRGAEMRFFGEERGAIVNMGKIEGHSVFLFANSVENHGTIKAKRVGLATGNKILLQPKGEQRIFIEASGDEESIDNRGKIEALTLEIKNASPYVLAVRSSGTLDATQTEKRGGKIFLVAEKGTVEFSGLAKASHIEMSGEQVYLYEHAKIEAPEGKVFIGGDPKNLTEGLISAQSVMLFPGSIVNTSSQKKGNGGDVYIYSDGATAHYGYIEARGGPKGGNGGFVEISGKVDLGFEGRVDHGAPMGEPGHFLTDPKNATITAAGGALPTPSLTFGVSSGASLSISGASLGAALDSGPVTIECNTDCTFDDTVTTTSSNALTIRTGRSCVFTGLGTFTSAGGDLNISINDVGAIPAERDAGVAAFTTTVGSSISTGGGDFIQSVGTFGGVQQGRSAPFSAAISASGGNISLEGYRLASEAGFLTAGIDCRSVVTTSGTGNITMLGRGGGGLVACCGVLFVTSSVSVENGLLSIDGIAGATATSTLNAGTLIFNTSLSSTGTAVNADGIDITGVGGGGSATADGIFFFSSNNEVTTVNGPIVMNGTGGTTTLGTSTTNRGIGLSSTPTVARPIAVESTGTGTISLTGTGGFGTTLCHGITVESSSIISSDTGAISLSGTVGTATGSGNSGVVMSTGTISSITSADIAVTGNGSSSGTDGSMGVQVTGTSSMVETMGSGAISLVGTGGATAGLGNNGIIIDSSGVVTSTGTGTISMIGTAGAGSGVNVGVLVSGLSTAVTSSTGDIMLTGIGAGSTSSNNGIAVLSSASVTGTVSANITMVGTGGGLVDDNNGVAISGSAIASVDSGRLSITGRGADGADRNNGIGIATGIVSSTSGEIKLMGTAGSGVDNCVGVAVSSSIITSDSGAVVLTGVGGGTGMSGHGVSLFSGVITSTGTAPSAATILIDGIGSSTNTNDAVGVSADAISLVSTLDGAISITGKSGANGATASPGIHFTASSKADSTAGTGTITFCGTGGTVAGGSGGIIIIGSGTSIVSDVGAISMTGIAGGNTEEGMSVLSLAEIESTGAAPIDVTTLSDLVLASGGQILGGAGAVTISVDRDFTITGSSVASENTGVLLDTGSANITVGRDMTLTGGSAADTPAQIGSRMTTSVANIIFPEIGGNLLVDGNTSGGYALIGHGTNSAETAYSGTIRFDLIEKNATVLGGSGSNGFALIGHLDAAMITGNILLTARDSLFVTGGTSATAVGQIGHMSAGACTSSTMRLIAGKNIELTSSTADAVVFNPCTVAAAGRLTLIVDNRFPTFPGIGSGEFILNSTLGTSGGQLRIYTVQPTQNSINDVINGQVFVPGTFNVDNANEQYDIYFNGGAFIGGSLFRIYYKVGDALIAARLADFLANTFYQLGVANSQLNLPLFRYMRLPNSPWYHGSFSDNYNLFDPGFDPYHSFIFEDNVYWIPSKEAI